MCEKRHRTRDGSSRGDARYDITAASAAYLNNPLELTAHSAGFVERRGVIACGPQLTGSVRGAADKAAHLMRCKSSAVHGPMRTASLSGAWGGNDPREARTYKPRLPCGGCRSGRSDRGGEPTCGPAHQRMTAASTRAPCCSRCTDMVERRPGPHEGKAEVVREATGTSTSRATGGGVQARRARGAESTSGRACSQQGLTATCTDLASEGTTEARGGGRMGA